MTPQDLEKFPIRILKKLRRSTRKHREHQANRDGLFILNGIIKKKQRKMFEETQRVFEGRFKYTMKRLKSQGEI